MTEQEALTRMVAPGTPRVGKWRQGVIQIWVTRACDNACYGCTQGSNLAGAPGLITPDEFEAACRSLKGYFGVVGMFGGNPAMHPKFEQLCEIMKAHIPLVQRGLWCNNPVTEKNARTMRHTFNPSVSNLNVHLNREAYMLFKRYWPESMPVGLDKDSRHSPVHLAMKDLDTLPGVTDGRQYVTQMPNTEENRWELISRCDINQHWSAMIGVFRGHLRAWFCEVAGAQAMLHQHEDDYPDTGLDPIQTKRDALTSRETFWWQLPMGAFRDQVRKHCHECGVPLRGHGELAMAGDGPEGGTEQTSETHAGVFKPKRQRKVQIVSSLEQLGTGRVPRVIDYLKNGAPK